MSFFNFSDEISVPFPSGKEITFYRCDPAELEGKKFRPLTNSAGVSQALEIGAIKAAARNGLYTASVAPSQLLQYSDGSLSSIIKEGGRFSRHAGFLRANGAVFSPLVVMQVVSVLTAQYFLAGINKNLADIRTRLTGLENLVYAEDLGTLLDLAERLPQKTRDPFLGPEDLFEVVSAREKAGSIEKKYFLLLENLVVPRDIEFPWWLWILSERRILRAFDEKISEELVDSYLELVKLAGCLRFAADKLYLYILMQTGAPQQKIEFFEQSRAETFRAHREKLISVSKKVYKSFGDLYRLQEWHNPDVSDVVMRKSKKWADEIFQIENSPTFEDYDDVIKIEALRPQILLLRLDRWGRKTPFIEADACA